MTNTTQQEQRPLLVARDGRKRQDVIDDVFISEALRANSRSVQVTVELPPTTSRLEQRRQERRKRLAETPLAAEVVTHWEHPLEREWLY